MYVLGGCQDLVRMSVKPGPCYYGKIFSLPPTTPRWRWAVALVIIQLDLLCVNTMADNAYPMPCTTPCTMHQHHARPSLLVTISHF